MRIRRSRPTRDFVQVPNATARDDRLSHMARGILLDILSRPAGWETTADDMWRASVARHGKDSPGRRAFRAAFAELKAHGYMSASREVLPGGKHSTVITISDVPHAGTSVPPAETRKSAGRTDVPHAGTSESGTSEPPAETTIAAGETDVPHAGTPEPPAQTALCAGRTDVPHAGTSLRTRENTDKKTGKQPARPADDDATPYPNDVLGALKTGIAARGVTGFSWRMTARQIQDIKTIMDRVGPQPMINLAVSHAQLKGAPAYATAWIAEWDSIEVADPTTVAANAGPNVRALHGNTPTPRPVPGGLRTAEGRNAARQGYAALAEELRQHQTGTST